MTFQEPQEPGSRCSYNEPAEMTWDLLCLECEDDQKAFKRMSFFLFLNLSNKCSIHRIPSETLGVQSMVGVVVLATRT